MKLKGALLLSTALLLVLSGSAMAADLAAPAAPVGSPPSAASWDGPYIGASIGYGWGTAADSYSGLATGTGAASPRGWLIGGQVGYNFHLSDNIVVGVQGDLDWLNEAGNWSFQGNPPTAATLSINAEGALLARLGVDAGQFLPYVEAGVGFANATWSGGISTSSHVHTGWAVGAGAEMMLADHLSGNVEYRYSDYGTQTYVNGPFNDHVHLSESSVRLGLNYHF